MVRKTPEWSGENVRTKGWSGKTAGLLNSQYKTSGLKNDQEKTKEWSEKKMGHLGIVMKQLGIE